MKTTNNFLEIDLANKIYANFVKKFDLSNYRSHCFYDSEKDDPEIHKFIFNISPELKSLAKNDFHMYCNSFLAKSRNIGPHFPSCVFKDHYQLVFPTENWGPGMHQSDEGEQVELKHNRLISSKTSQQRVMDFISIAMHPIIYLNILSG
jgi:hypothetical protein